MMLWFLIIIAVNSNGTVSTSLQYPTRYTFNNEAACESNGRKISDEFQLERGTKNSKIFWDCKPVELEAIIKMLPPS